MKRSLFALLLAGALAGCYGDRGVFEATTTIEVSRKGCMPQHAHGTSSLVVNLSSETLPDGRVRCVIETVHAKK